MSDSVSRARPWSARSVLIQSLVPVLVGLVGFAGAADARVVSGAKAQPAGKTVINNKAQVKPLKEKSAVPSVSVLRDVQYGLAGGVRLLMNITLPDPAPRKAVPAIVFFHGGGWSGGSREDMMSRCDMATKAGYVGASVEYRLSGSDARFSAAGSAPFPAQLQDCKCAVRYLRANAAKYGIDPNRIAVWGCSAGGHLAAMMGVTENIAEFEGDGGSPGVSSRVQMVVDCFGPTDFVAWEEEVNKWAQDKDAQRLFAPPPGDEGMVQWWANFGLERDPGVVKLFEGKARERAAWASPVTYADGSLSIKALSQAEKWQDQDAYRSSISQPGSRWALLDLGNAESWARSEFATTGLKLSSQAGGVTGKCLTYEVQNVENGWGTFSSKIPDGLFRPAHNAIALWAKGDANTSEVLLEVDEKDGSRWIYTLRISPEWTYYEIPFARFANLPDPQVKAHRGGFGDKLNGRSAAKISIGLARGLTALTAGAHSFQVDGLGSARSSLSESPIFLIVHGSLDTWVPVQQSFLFANALDKSGADVTFLLKPNAGHDESKAFPEIMEFVKKRLPITPESK